MTQAERASLRPGATVSAPDPREPTIRFLDPRGAVIPALPLPTPTDTMRGGAAKSRVIWPLEAEA
jgi:hypothetical protein